MFGPEPEGATPLSAEDRRALLADWVATRDDLNLAEQANIAAGRTTVMRGRPLRLDQVLDDTFVRRLHRRMFDQVWAWAGAYRTIELNIGVDPWQVPGAVRDLVADARFWLAPDVGWIAPDVALCKVHHRLVQIHPFVNGNGRHARTFTDVLTRSVGRPLFSWGAGTDLQEVSPDRAAYLAALKRADAHPDDLDDLVAFARS
ncbi:mobile mystery protein B [Luteipulveratus mongoliensis]|uniref:Fido domain-containing protein n=1 Tax=Luteipulveratus mongoliensis TaxID=571913 RepID=A0A0K1JL96_9MICO|nr:mobile mystery protein B [Luteipulveratus mongoliensis]AKU17499.1 hypothetical protein VV02_19390 [Luteipulveratus mongoliensis]